MKIDHEVHAENLYYKNMSSSRIQIRQEAQGSLVACNLCVHECFPYQLINPYLVAKLWGEMEEK